MDETARSSIYAQDAANQFRWRALSTELRTRIAVIGGGLTELSTALHLAEAGQDVVLLEAYQPGWGASGRNGGQLNPGLKYDPSQIIGKFGTEAGNRLVEFGWSTVQRTADLIGRLGIDCDLRLNGTLRAAARAADVAAVMADGKVLVDGTVEDAKNSKQVRDIYIGSGTSEVAASARQGQFVDEQILALDKVNLHYGKSHILQDVTFDLHKGEILALLGRNGAGKSSVLKAITGIVPPSSGSVQLMNHELAGNTSAQIARLGIGYVPQGRGLFAGMTVRENLELGRIRRQTGEGTHWSLDELLEYFPRLRERLDTPADSLSGGEQQMAAVARALSGDIRVLLLDEPFEGLAPAIVEQLFRTFDKLRDRLSIVIVDHNLDLALSLSDRTIVLERGRVLHEIESRRIAEDIELRREMLWM